MAHALMIQGTGSDVGKSLLVAGLARALTQRGMCVRPFKPQNMSNNAAATSDGGEIGRAQALQARAAQIAPSVHMNPVLLKPQNDIDAQVIVQGRILDTPYAASAYQDLKPRLMAAVRESFEHLSCEADIVLVEGAGSPAETNLRAGDIANMGFARALDVPVLLTGDIERGGVIASLVGTHTVLDAEDRAMIAGFLVNKFRGDVSLFDGGLTEIAARTGWSSLGILPYLHGLTLPSEDAVEQKTPSEAVHGKRLRVAVPVFPHIANSDDFDPLQLEPSVNFRFVMPGTPLPQGSDLIILPGSKATLSDLRFLKTQGWDIDISAHLRQGGAVLGICGGYQMLGRSVSDPAGLEGIAGAEAGLGLLDLDTELSGDKMLRPVTGTCALTGGRVHGYEMHIGRTHNAASARALLHLDDGRKDGVISRDGHVMGCYVHGLFAEDALRASLLAHFGGGGAGIAYDQTVEDSLDRLAAAMEAHLDIDRMLTIARTARPMRG